MNFMTHLGILIAGVAGFALWPNLRTGRSSGDSESIKGIPCSAAERRQPRSNRVAVTVAIQCDGRFEFTLRRKQAFDRVAEVLGLIHEFETQDDRFDDTVY